MAEDLFTPFRLGDVTLANRMVMAPMTRNRADENGVDFSRAQAALSSGAADLIAFGAPFLANPDLVRRYRDNLPLNEVDPATFYVGGEAGYIDYPVYRSEYLAA